MADIDLLRLLDAKFFQSVGYLFLAAPAKRGRNDVVQVVAVAGETVLVDSDLHVGIRLATGGVANRDLAVRLATSVQLFGDRVLAAAPGRCRDDVACVICVTGEPVGVDRDLNVGVGIAARGMADGDSLVIAHHLLFYFLSHLLGAASGRCRNNVIAVVTVAV